MGSLQSSAHLSYQSLWAHSLALPLLMSTIGSSSWLFQRSCSGPALGQLCPQLSPKRIIGPFPPLAPPPDSCRSCHWPALTLCAAALVAIRLVHALGSIPAGCAGALIHIQLTHGPTEAWSGECEINRGTQVGPELSPLTCAA